LKDPKKMPRSLERSAGNVPEKKAAAYQSACHAEFLYHRAGKNLPAGKKKTRKGRYIEEMNDPDKKRAPPKRETLRKKTC